MKRVHLFLALVILFFVSNVYAESPIMRIVVEEIKSATADTLAMPGTMTEYTKSFSLRDTVALTAMYRTTATGAVSYNAAFQASLWPPTTEGAADDAWRTIDPLNGAIILQQWEIATIDTISLPYGRFIITSTANPNDAVLEMSIGKQ